jgi:hypothetical protein
VTLQEAIALANRVKPLPRAALDKLGNVQLTALEKRWWNGLIENVTDVQQRLDQVAADVEFLSTLTPGQPPRRLHS